MSDVDDEAPRRRTRRKDRRERKRHNRVRRIIRRGYLTWAKPCRYIHWDDVEPFL